MKKRKVFLAIVVILFGAWLISSAKELYVLMNKHPKAFQQPEGFSLIRLYNTYQTLSFSEVMIQQGHVSAYYCNFIPFEDDQEKLRLWPLVRDAYYDDPRTRPDNYLSVDNNVFMPLGANCVSESKLINFTFKENEAYATFSCEREGVIQEFSYSSSGGEKCGVIQYKKGWGIQPIERTLDYAMKLKLF